MTTERDLSDTVNQTPGVIYRISDADTPRKLTNARRAFLKWHRLIRKQVDELYPPISGGKKVKGAFCPMCRLPMVSYSQLAGHLIVKHRWVIGPSLCPCGYNGIPSPKAKIQTMLAKHLAGQRDASGHIVHWEMIRSTP